jgi:Tfp pilus assembly protein PilF
MSIALRAAAVVAAVLLAGEARADDPTVQAKALNQQGLELLQAKRYDEAERLLTQAMQLCDGPLHEEHFCVAGVGENLADVATGRGDLPRAEQLLSRAAAVTLAAKGQDPQYAKLELKLGQALVHEQKFAEAELPLKMAVTLANAFRNARWVSSGVSDLSLALNHLRRSAEAEDLLRKLLILCPQAEPTCEATARGRLGETLIAEGREPEAQAELKRSAELYAALGVPASRDAVLLTLAERQAADGQLEEAQASYETLVANLRGRADAPPGVTGVAEANLAQVLLRLDRPDKAAAMATAARKRLDDARTTPGDAAAVAVRLAVLDISRRRTAEARALVEKALATPDPPGLQAVAWRAEGEGVLGDLDYLAGRFDTAETHFRKSAALSGVGGDLALSHARLNSAAQALIAESRYAEADALLGGLIAEAAAQTPPAPEWRAQLDANLALSRNAQGDHKGALAAATEALALAKPPPGRPQGTLIGALDQAGAAEHGLGRYDLAEAHFTQALAQADAVHDLPAFVASIRFELCQDYNDWGKRPQARACADAAAAMLKAWPEASDADRAAVLVVQADVTFMEGDYAKAADLYQASVALREKRPAFQERAIAAGYVSLGQARAANGEPAAARAALVKGEALFARIGAPAEVDRIEAGRRVGDLDVAVGDAGAAEAPVRAAVAWYEAQRGPTHPRTALQLRSLGLVLMGANRPGEAEPVLRRALEIRQAQPAPNLSQVAQSLSDLGDCEAALGRLAQARDLLARAATIEAEARGKDAWEIGVVTRQLGELDLGVGRLSEAEAAFQRAAPLLAGGGEAALSGDLALQRDLAALRVQQGRRTEARRILAASLARAERAFGADNLKLVPDLWAMADLDREDGRFDAAEAGVKRILAIRGKAMGERSPGQIGAWLQLASLRAGQVHVEDAQQALDQALAIAKATIGLDGAPALGVILRAADLETAIGRTDAARDLARRGLALARAAQGDSTRLVIAALSVAGAAAQQAHELSEADTLFSEALARSQALWGQDAMETFWASVQLAGVKRDEGRFGEAQSLLERAQGISARTLPPDHALNILVLLHQSEARRAGGDLETAERLAKQALSMLEASGRGASPTAGYAQITLGRVYGAEGDAEEAGRALEAARVLIGNKGAPAARR